MGLMSWVKTDDQMNQHPKVVRAGPFADLLNRRAITYSGQYLLDGKIPRNAVSGLVDWSSEPMLQGVVVDCFALAKRLVDARLWIETDDGYEIHDYLKWNPSREEVIREREKEKTRKEAGRSKQGRDSAGRISVAPGVPMVVQPDSGRTPDGTPPGRGPDTESPPTGVTPVPSPSPFPFLDHTHTPRGLGADHERDWQLAAAQDPVVAELALGADLYPGLPAARLQAAADRMRRATEAEPTAKRDGLTAQVVASESVAATREWATARPDATEETKLARVESHGIRFVLGDCRKGKRRVEPEGESRSRLKVSHDEPDSVTEYADVTLARDQAEWEKNAVKPDPEVMKAAMANLKAVPFDVAGRKR